jgi:uncharacterized protein YpuA (DUF1002 family)
MSRKIEVNFEVRNMLIMKETLKQMNIDFNQINDHLVDVSRRYNNISINSSNGQISFNSDDRSTVNSIKQTYMVNFYKDEAIREGMNLVEECDAKTGEIVLVMTR